MSTPSKVPTYSIEDERAVLGALLTDNRILGRLQGLSEADFYGPRNASAFAAISRIVGSGDVADVLTVRQQLATGDEAVDRDMVGYLVELVDAVPSLSNARAYAAAVRKHAERRALIAAADEAQSLAWTEPDATLAVDTITSRFGALTRKSSAKGPRSLAEIALERMEYYTALEEGSVVPGWSTGLPWLDRTLNGGLRVGSLYILAARPSVGKSSLAQSMGITLAEAGLPTLFLSMEMAESEVADRGVANVGRVSYSALLTGKMSHDDWNRATEALERMAKLSFRVDDQPQLKLSEIRAKAKSVKGLKVLVVDYLQLSDSTRKDGNRNSEIEAISRGLKALAKELQCAVIALSQLNRDVEKRATRRPTLSDLRDSGAIEQDADVVMFLWPVGDADSQGRRLLGLGVDKNRQGRLGEIGLDFHGDTQRWEQSSADIRPAPSKGGDL